MALITANITAVAVLTQYTCDSEQYAVASQGEVIFQCDMRPTSLSITRLVTAGQYLDSNSSEVEAFLLFFDYLRR